MRFIVLIIAACSLNSTVAQSRFYNRTFEARYMEKPPVFSMGPDSMKRFYFHHFPAFDTVLKKAVENGDTATFIRVYFSFSIDEHGFPFDPQFHRIASTRSAVTEGARTLRYFSAMKSYLQDAVTTMFRKMPQWRPGLENGMPVKASCYDYLQFWCGLSVPQ